MRRGIFGDLNLQTVISGVSCNGSESKLLGCQFNKDPFSTCGVFNDAAVVCQSEWSNSANNFISALAYVHELLFQMSQSLIIAQLEKFDSCQPITHAVTVATLREGWKCVSTMPGEQYVVIPSLVQ